MRLACLFLRKARFSADIRPLPGKEGCCSLCNGSGQKSVLCGLTIGLYCEMLDKAEIVEPRMTAMYRL